MNKGPEKNVSLASYIARKTAHGGGMGSIVSVKGEQNLKIGR